MVGNNVMIGDRVLIAHNVNIFDNISHPRRASLRHQHVKDIFLRGHPAIVEGIDAEPVRIESDVWIGFGATVLRGVTIGRGVIIGANSVITKDVLAWTLVGGNTAAVVRSLADEEREDGMRYFTKILYHLLKVIAYLHLKRTGMKLYRGTGGRHYLWRVVGAPSAKMSIGPNSIVLTRVIFERPGGEIQIGERTFVGSGLISLAHRVDIGDDVLISWGVTITDHTSHRVQFSKRAHDVVQWSRGEKDWSNVLMAPVRINNKAWIGFNTIILKGVTIGEGAVVGAGSVVTKDVPPWTIVAGNPARIIREIPEHER